MLEDLVPWLYLLRALGVVGAVLSVLGSLAVCEYMPACCLLWGTACSVIWLEKLRHADSLSLRNAYRLELAVEDDHFKIQVCAGFARQRVSLASSF